MSTLTYSTARAVLALSISLLLTTFVYAPFAGAARPNTRPKTSRRVHQQSAPPYRDRELLVRFRMGVAPQERDLVIAGIGARKKKQLEGDSGIENLELPVNRDVATAAMQLLLDPRVEFAEPNFLIAKDDIIPNDSRFNEQWALRNTGQNGGQFGSDVQVSAAWSTTTGSAATVIAVIDSGIDFTHPDLANNQWTNPTPGANQDLHGWDYVQESAEIKDEQGHGTAVAGIIAAEGNNSFGITGVMWRASLMSLRVLDNTGTGDIANAVEAIDYALAHGAQVINLSWGTTAESLALKDAIERAGRRNVAVVCSAGNGSQSLDASPYYPASFALPNLIAVAATDNLDQLASWSNWGPRTVSVAAPGINILTTQRGAGYWNVTGTSAAAPLVTGIAGLLKTLRPLANVRLLVRAIGEGARQITSLSGKVSSSGVASAAGALTKMQGAPNQSPPLPPPGRGTGGTGPGGSFSTTPPATTTGAPGPNLPNLDQLRSARPQQPKANAPIQSNLMCADCDPQGGGGGSSYYPPNDPNFSTARRKLVNETGEPNVDLGSRNFNWSVPLLTLPGRAGLDLNLTLTYNSLVWTKDGSYMKFNADFGSPAPGFRLGLPTLQQKFLNSQTGIWAYMMVTPSGGRVELRQIGSSNIYESQDSTYTQLDASDVNALLVRTTDGTQFTFNPVNVNGEYRCTKIKDRNGNYISATYDTGNGHLLTITDTLGRVINFIYDGNHNLQAIKQTWNGATHDWATFTYGEVYVAPAFGGGLSVNGPNGIYTTVLTQVNLHDSSYFVFDYNAAFAQITQIKYYAPDSSLLNYIYYNLNTAAGQTECPRVSARRDWARYWNGDTDGLPVTSEEAVTSYSVAGDGSWTQQTTPDQIIYKEFFATSGWQSGLTTRTEIWLGNVQKKWTSISWTQDNTSLSYQKNPRVIETNIGDEANNPRRTVIDYGAYAQYGLPYEIREFDTNGTTELRQTYYDYNLSQTYLDRRIIGLVSYVRVSNVAQWQSKISYTYDDPSRLQAVPAAATQHDTAYNASLTARGNLTGVSHWDVTDINNANKALTTYTNYYTTGTPISLTDSVGHPTSIAYTDVFSDNVNRNTYAYPTTITDADGFQSLAKYNFDFGGVTWRQTPSPNTGQTAPSESIFYDSATRIQQITNNVTNAHVRWVYPTSGTSVSTFTTIVDTSTEAFSGQFFDGAGRVRAVSTDHPGSSGLYSGQYFIYNNMGRLAQQSNPIEITANWLPAGDDSAWVYTLQAYDWKGRPTVTTLPDGTTRENLYGGCGCAGGAVTTVRDEQGRRRKLTMDVFGRLKQVDELNWNQSTYSTTTYTYNVSDQLTSINQGNQARTFAYDGYGRLLTRTTPEQGATSYSYYSDDTVQTITDARNVKTTFTYNSRHLVTGITYDLSLSTGVAATPNVTFVYDAAGNRTSMTDGLGSVSYKYDQLSRLTSETRMFNEVGSFALTYAYNVGDELTSITNQWGAQVGYTYDKVGRPTSVSGSGYAGVSSYVSSIAYRAFGLKEMHYSNTLTLSTQYDNRLRLTQWSIPGVLPMQYSYTWEQSGRVEFVRNQDDQTLDRYFAYDHVGRLTTSRSGNEARLAIGEQVPLAYNGPYSHGYQYDQFGNMTYREGWGGENPSFTATYTNNKRTGLTYDPAGNLTNDGGQAFTYDATGQAATASYNGYLLQQYYDGDGLRVKKSDNGVVAYYLRSSVLGGKVVAEIKGGGMDRGYVYLGDQLLAVQSGTAVWWMHEDPVAKSKRVTNSSGTVVSTIELDPWGGNTYPSSNDVFQPHRFTTYERDGNLSDEAMFRRYNRWWSRFDQPDPHDGSYDFTDPQSFNRYAYVQNDPVTFVDPSGLLDVIVFWTWGFYDTGPVGNPSGFGVTDRKAPVRELPERDSNPQNPSQPPAKSDCARLVDDLVPRAGKALWGGRADAMLAQGRAMGLMAKNGRFSKGHNDPSLGVSGFQNYLISGGQGADIYKHIYGVAGAVLIGDHYVAFGKSITPAPGAQAARTGWGLVYSLLDSDKAQLNDPKHHNEALAEVADDYAAIDVGKWMGQSINGTLSRDQLRQNIFNRLCNH